MKKLLLLLLLFDISNNKINAQSFGDSHPCEYNVYDGSTSGNTRKICIDATFKFATNNGQCTGTLINRNTNDDDLGFYFITAWHCFEEWDGQEIDFYFNYQSKDASNTSVPETNQGAENNQSKLYDASTDNNKGYQYHHRSYIREIASYSFGDFKLFEILTPIPPHFNVTYAGWTPTSFRYLNSFGQFATIHHPEADIKKISETSKIFWEENVIATACYTVTKVIDFLTGWMWKRKWSTSVICKYMTNPWFTVPYWDKGAVEHGSSGSGMFSNGNLLFGTLSGDPFGINICSDVVFEPYGKLVASYSNAIVKNTMNPIGGPENRALVDLYGMHFRKIICYPNLDLPGAPNVSGEYFPAQDYQPENTITLQAINDITTNAPINIYPNADYRFRAGNTIILDSGFHADEGSLFIAEIGECQFVAQKGTDTNSELMAALKQIQIPKRKDFNMNRFAEGTLLNDNELYAHIFPNPNTGSFTVKMSVADNYDISLSNVLGNIVYSAKIVNEREHRIETKNINPGTYFIHIGNGKEQFSGKIIIQK